MAEAAKPKLYHWTGLTDAADDWIAHNIRLDALLTAAGCMTVCNRLIQQPLLVPIPDEPQPPVGVHHAAPTPAQISQHTYQVSFYKLLRDSYDRIVKVHEKAEENAEKAFNKYAELHAPLSKLITGILNIQVERRAAAVKIVADFTALGFTYETARALILANAPADAAVIAILTPIVNAYPVIITGATNVAILYASQDYIEREFAPGKVEQRAIYADQLEKLRDYDVPEGASECIRRFITTLGYLEKSGGVLPTQAIEEAVKKTFTSSNYADWIKEMGMETLRLTPYAERKYSWQLVIKDIGLLVTRDPTQDEFRVQGGKKRSAAQAGYSEVGEPYRRPRDTFSAPGTHDQIIDARVRMADRGGGRWYGTKPRGNHLGRTGGVPNRTVHVQPSHYEPTVQPKSRVDADATGHCWRCWSTHHFAVDCQAERCTKCTAPIKGGVSHNARICTVPRNAEAGRGRGMRRDVKTERGGRSGRGGRGN